MITNQKILEHLKEINNLETQKEYTYIGLFEQVNDFDCKKIFNRLAREKNRHKTLLKKITALIKTTSPQHTQDYIE